MKTVEGNSEFKQRVNLSSHALQVLAQDFESCSGEMSKSGFYNNIISNYYKKASATVSIAVERRRSELYRSLASFRRTAELDRIIEQLVADYLQELTQNRKSKSLPKGESELFRLNKNNFHRLYGDGKTPGLESEYYDRPSVYLKELFEEFARLPSSQREEIYLNSLIDRINGAEGHPLEISLGTNRYLFRPYRILPDGGLTHLYLIGLSTPLGKEDTPEQIACFRLSNLRDHVEVRKDLPKASPDKYEQRNIEERIRKNGVQFLLADTQKIKVRFHYNGEKLFRQKTYMRPVPVEITDDGVYVFDCAQRQAANYFFTFGCQVQILEPEKLRRDFALGYQRAWEQYEE